MELTQTSKDEAQAYLRNNNYNLTAALNEYFRHAADSSTVDVSGAKAQLHQMFNELVSTEEEDPAAADAINEMNIDSCMAYINRLGADPDSYEMFVVSDIVRAKAFGSVERDGFVDGWARVFEESKGRVAPTWDAQKAYVRSRINAVATDSAYFKSLYDFVFQIGKEPPQKSLDMAYALSFWAGLFAPTMNSWRSAHVDWLAAWTDYLREKFGKSTVDEEGGVQWEYTRSVSKDLWNQTRLFAAKTMEDETLGFWSEEQAWPGLIDEFVVWCREKGKVGPPRNGEGMEVDE